MADSALTQEMIAEAMARAENVACRPGDERCYPFPDRLAGAHQLHPKGAVSGWLDRGQRWARLLGHLA